MNKSVPVETKGDFHVPGQYSEAGAVYHFHHPVGHRDQAAFDQVLVTKTSPQKRLP
jgi:hypothetical protein